MLAENVSLGVLALSQALAILGIVPGLLCICFLGVIATYTGWLIGEFKLAFPQVQSFPDCGELIAGRVGREVMALGSVLILIFHQWCPHPDLRCRHERLDGPWDMLYPVRSCRSDHLSSARLAKDVQEHEQALHPL